MLDKCHVHLDMFIVITINNHIITEVSGFNNIKKVNYDNKC